MSYKFDFHVHSKYSYDSISFLKKILKTAKKKGLSGIAITDHETIQGAIKLFKINKDKNFKIIIGSEIKTECGDVIGLFLKKEIKSRECFEVIKEIKLQGGIVVLPHPFKKTSKLTQELLSKVDVIEVFNSRLNKEQNQKAQKLAQEMRKPGISGSDAHLISEIGNSYVTFNNISEIKERILKGDCIIYGISSPKYVHYVSAFIGNCRKGSLGKTIFKMVFK